MFLIYVPDIPNQLVLLDIPHFQTTIFLDCYKLDPERIQWVIKLVISKQMKSILFLLLGWTQGIALFPVESCKDPRPPNVRERKNSGLWNSQNQRQVTSKGVRERWGRGWVRWREYSNLNSGVLAKNTSDYKLNEWEEVGLGTEKRTWVHKQEQ